MEIVWLNTEVDAIHYVYDYAVPKQIPLDTFEKFVRSSKEGTLPEFYVISEMENISDIFYYWPTEKKIFRSLLHFLHVIMVILYQKKITEKCWNLSINSVMQTDGINSLGWLNKKVINCKNLQFLKID